MDLRPPTDMPPAGTLPPPPPAAPLPVPTVAATGAQFVPPRKLVGQLSPMWRLVFTLGWAGIVAGQAAVWETSRVIGLSTWWLGADAEPRMLLVQLLPFYGPLLVCIVAISNGRMAPYFGLGAAALGAAVALGDINRVRWIAIVELTLAAAGLCISAASLAGMYRAPRQPGSIS